MPTGDNTVSIINTYDTLALAVAGWNGLSTTVITDHFEIIVLPGGQGTKSFALIKVEVAA